MSDALPPITERTTLPAEENAAGFTEAGHRGRRFSVLFLHPGPQPPHDDPQKNALFHLSRVCEGDLLTLVWRDVHVDPREASAKLGGFNYHYTAAREFPGFVRTFYNGAWMLWNALRLAWRRGGYDAVVTYGPYTLSIAGLILRAFTRTRLIIEVPGPPTDGFLFESGFSARLKLRLARVIVPFLIRRADATRLYYSWQLDSLPGSDRFPPAYVFPDFVPISSIPEPVEDPDAPTGRYILFLGHPFSRKGVDVLIKAFNLITDRHPDVMLRIVGHCPDPEPWRRLVDRPDRVVFQKGILHQEAMQLMSNCSLFALPSRMEGVPRVLIEAMAARRPVVSTRASGIPALVEHGVSGLLSDVDNVEDFAANMDRILSDPEYARRLGAEGYRHVREDLAEQRFVERFAAMMEEVADAGGT